MLTSGQILETSQLADHFYAIVHGLTGRDMLYKNPGVSLRSYVAANCRSRILEIPEELTAAFDECVSFNNDPDVHKAINEVMRNKPFEVLEAIMKVRGGSKQINHVQQHLMGLIRILDKKGTDVSKGYYDHEYIQTLINIKGIIEDLVNVYENVTKGRK